ncbi:MAG: S8 family serine peptidase [Bdellovibrionia bacterium]
MKLQKHSKAILAAATLLGFAAQTSNAAVIAVVDSGTDFKHPDLVSKTWNNPGEVDDAVDNDNNGLIDDLHGWNFADSNNRLVDRKLIGTWSEDVYKYFDLQTKMLNGEASEADIAWLKSHVKDETFIAELEKFGNHVHGTHVSGITARDADAAQVMALRMIGGGSPSMLINGLQSVAVPATAAPSVKEKLVNMALTGLALAQGQGLAPVGKYLASKKPQVANCSFGASRNQIEPILKPLIEKILGRELTADELHAYSTTFLNKVVDVMKKTFIDPAKNTLFVIAAGNDGTDNDVAPASPANVKTDNTITVAATLGHSKLASFSNYGATMVDIAAPGVGIVSTIPGGGYMPLSGTSQASPYVANLAGRVLDANPHLTPLQVKNILMGTVDKKAFLAKKVRSEGIANPDRAVYAAKLSLQMPVTDAVSQANRQVPALKAAFGEGMMDDSAIAVLPLPSFLK